MTLRNRISTAAAVGVLLVVAAVSTVLYFSYAGSLHSRADAGLVAAAQQAITVAQDLKQSASNDHAGAGISQPVTIGTIQLQLIPGPVTLGQSTASGPLDGQDVAVADLTAPAYFADATEDGQRYRVYTAALPGSSGGGLVRASQGVNADDGTLRTAALLLAGLTAGAAALMYGASRLTVGRILRPIADLTAAAERVTSTRDLSIGIGAVGTDEVGRLGISFGAMLAALHESVTAQRMLVADASHELRTPLTSLTTNLELLEDGAGLADPQAPALVRAAREQAGELDQLINDLLDLARYRETAPHKEVVRLDLLTGDAVRRLRSRAIIEADLRPCLAEIDPAAVDRAITNLIDNAIKWSPPDAGVHVRVRDGQVSVTDHGPGIADSDLPRIFERFYRAPTARAMPGAGLGLAIVGGVAEANNATLGVQTSPAGSTFTLSFAPPAPLTAASAPGGRPDLG
jgi:two-component system, OmpR family, sensor histidine kinase MprB